MGRVCNYGGKSITHYKNDLIILFYNKVMKTLLIVESPSKCKIIEVSTPHFNDRVRVEKKYNLPSEGGLPSTRINEVILK